MAIKFQYNKTSLQQLNKQLKIRLRALPTLQSKEAALRMEVKRAKDQSEELLEKLKPVDPMVFAQKALKEITRNKPVIVIPSKFKTIWRINRLFPSLGLKIHEKVFLNTMKKAGRL